MKSLTVKLTLAFLLVGLTGAVLVAAFLRYRLRRDFDRLILDQNQQALVSILTRYYRLNGSWTGVDGAFSPGNDVPVPSRNTETRWDARRNLFVIANADGDIVFGGRPDLVGRQLDSRELNRGVKLELNGDTIGWLIFTPTIDRWVAGTAEGNFMVSITQALYFSAIAATGVALILGGILAYSLTRSLRELTAATKELQKGRLGYQVEVHSEDELGELANSFNQMSAELERSTQLRRKMTADIAHDLRSPLTVLTGYTEALSDAKLQPTPEIFETMHSEALHLSHLVDDLKTLSLADAGELPLAYQRVSADILLNRAASAHRVQAESKDITIGLDIEPQLPEIEVDVERMVQVLGNLMNNAIRFTPSGGQISLSARQTGNQVQLSIADTGVGIAAEDLPFIFERSYRGDKARRHPEGESGLGLSIAKSLVQAQGGTITAESEPEKGTTFTIHLPADK
jgi:signal transduction histidine kinase